jgi:hypothetical protein
MVMRHFYRLFEGVLNVPLMNAVMGYADKFEQTIEPGVAGVILRNGADLPSMSMFNAKKFALGIMQLVDGTQLGIVLLERIDAGAKLSLGSPAQGFTRFITVLLAHEGCGYICNDESVPFRTGEAWRVGGAGIAYNKSDDDLIFMVIDVRVD